MKINDKNIRPVSTSFTRKEGVGNTMEFEQRAWQEVTKYGHKHIVEYGTDFPTEGCTEIYAGDLPPLSEEDRKRIIESK